MVEFNILLRNVKTIFHEHNFRLEKYCLSTVVSKAQYTLMPGNGFPVFRGIGSKNRR